MKLTEQIVRAELESHGYWDTTNNNPLLVVNYPTYARFLIFGDFVYYNMRQYLANFKENGIYMIALSKWSAKPIDDKDLVIKQPEIGQ